MHKLKTGQGIGRRIGWLGAVGCLVFSVILGWQPLSAWLERRSAPESDPATPAAIAYLDKAWRANNLNSRKAGLAYLLREMRGNPALFAPMEAAVLTATKDGDFEVRELAFAILFTRNHPEIGQLAENQLADVDPAVRLLGLQYLARKGEKQNVPAIITQLDDTDPHVLGGALSALRHCTGKASGTPVIADGFAPDYHGTNDPGPVAIATWRREALAWKTWWSEHEGEFPKPRATLASGTAGQAAQDFSLHDVADKEIHLGALKGKVVLVTVFDHKLHRCREELAVLAELQHQYPDRLAVLAIYLDTSESHDCDKMHTPEALKEHELALAKARAELQQHSREQRINYPLLMDPHHAVIENFGGQLPATYILIDPQGTIRRRFLGGRPLATLERMVKELHDPPVTLPVK